MIEAPTQIIFPRNFGVQEFFPSANHTVIMTEIISGSNDDTQFAMYLLSYRRSTHMQVMQSFCAWLRECSFGYCSTTWR